MKKITFSLSFLFSVVFAYAQPKGLQQVIVEKYYIAAAADAAQADVESTDNGLPTGALPVGSVTYRVYADMLPGYKLLSVFGDVVSGHKLKIRTTTNFYNNPLGGTTPASTKNAIKNKLLALDSWFSLGGVATGQYGVLKTDDDSLLNNVTTASNPNGVLLSTDPGIGIPLTSRDGMIAGTGIQSVSFAGITNETDVFGDGTILGDSIVVVDGAVFTATGASGPNPDTNRVLIAQITTDGDLSFELNILIKPDGSTTGEFFVANNPQAGEDSIPSLTYPPPTDPVGIKDKQVTADSPAVPFDIYPNPANDVISLEIKDIVQNGNNAYTLYGIAGNVIMQKQLGGAVSGKYREKIDISSLANGVYFIEVSVNGAASTKRIIKN